ncbi:C2H2-type domain-containing protein [Aphelenchoides bicaudatus]|nr:C2H2-type domain-containing protein [Aphelenchoides bicaudatus]
MSSLPVENSVLGHNENDSEEYIDLPEWLLIDEISIALLEQGIGEFELLQRALPSVVLAKCERINEVWTEKRLLKMFRLAQLQLQYILKSQNELVKKLTLEKEKYRKVHKENGKIKRSLSDRPDTSRELFKCNDCDKIFLHTSFLFEHIERRHTHTQKQQHNTDSHFRAFSSVANHYHEPKSTDTSVWR